VLGRSSWTLEEKPGDVIQESPRQSSSGEVAPRIRPVTAENPLKPDRLREKGTKGEKELFVRSATTRCLANRHCRKKTSIFYLGIRLGERRPI